jgi:7-carboxy-7-deazaguanine synthase
MLKINEIFYSIQGESLHAGLACVFIRLTGCNLRCIWCDTRYAYTEGLDMTIGDILDAISVYPCRLIGVTGGEPLVQAETPELIHCLLAQGYTVLMETNGSLDIDRVDRRCVRIIDVKCPSSGQDRHNDLSNLNRVSELDQLKFVIASRADYEFARDVIENKPAWMRDDHILFSPANSLLNPEYLAKWILDDGLGIRFHLQLHKIIWPGVDRGV